MRVIYHNQLENAFFVDGNAFRSDDYKSLEDLKKNHLKKSQLRHHGQLLKTRKEIYDNNYIELIEFKSFTNSTISKIKSSFPELFL